MSDVKDELKAFVGQQLIECADEIQVIARRHKLSVNIINPAFPGPIDNDASRLNVRIDKRSKVVSYSIG